MPKTRKVDIVRGDLWPGDSYDIINVGVDLGAGTVVPKIQVRDKPNGTIYLTLNPTPSYPIVGEMTFTISFTGAQTAVFPIQVLVADVQISGPSYGPLTLLSYQFNVIPDVTL